MSEAGPFPSAHTQARSAEGLSVRLAEQPLLQVEQLTTRLGRGGPEILSAIDLQLAAGEVLGVVGESGSGKSMLALSIMGLLPPAISASGGVVRFQGEDILRLPAAQMQRLRGKDLAMIFQEPMTSLNPVMRVGQQLAEVLRWHLGLKGDAARREGIALLQRVEMPDAPRQIDAYPHELSGGMRQRVMIAMALAGRPKLLIADEPTTALDVTIQAQILDLIRNIQQDTGMAVLLITHDLGVIAEMSDRVAVMYAGRIVESASALELFDRPAHPYTRGLLASRPKIASGSAWLSTIEGTVPAVGQLPAGCSFAPRCPMAHAACAVRPPLAQVAPAHRVACVLPFEAMPAAAPMAAEAAAA
ncbi:MAG: ABC transporter ATP-binding protein [Variovorax sp.]